MTTIDVGQKVRVFTYGDVGTVTGHTKDGGWPAAKVVWADGRSSIELLVDLEIMVDVQAVESALVDAIEMWMEETDSQTKYLHGNAQGIARALSKLRGTTFLEEWSSGLDAYQRRVVLG